MSAPGFKKYSFPIANQYDVILEVPAPMSEEDFDSMVEQLTMFFKFARRSLTTPKAQNEKQPPR